MLLFFLTMLMLFSFVILLFIFMVIIIYWNCDTFLLCAFRFWFDFSLRCLLILYFLLLLVFLCGFLLFVLLFFLTLLVFSFFLRLSSFSGFIIVLIFLILVEFFRDISNACPVFNNLFMLTTHLNEKSPPQNFTIKTVSNKVNCINFDFKNNLEWSWIVVLHLDKFILRKSLLDIFFCGFKVTFDKIQRNMFNIIIQCFNLINDIFFLRVGELFFLMFLGHECRNNK